MKSKTIETSEPSTATSTVNYILNKVMPFLCVGAVLFYELGWVSPVPYFVLGLMWFASHFSFSCGYSTAVVENNFSHMIMSLADEAMDEDDIIKTKEEKTK
jgi:hypothetical protein